VARRTWDFELQRDRKSISSVWPQNLQNLATKLRIAGQLPKDIRSSTQPLGQRVGAQMLSICPLKP
jgi:hypothetical protein